ncbi:Rossmann-fold NAD(P)-binding domain-containing protein [Paraburkholderia fungorum]|uniref:hypothetical protein n=1 Tax=Paraburkholderia fungorum TaxID=134537 RepID=UPI0038BC64D3
MQMMNTARKNVVVFRTVPDDLLERIRASHDVFAVEPLAQDSPLRTHSKVTPFPHTGSATHETRRATAELATDNLPRVLGGEAAVSAFDLSTV